MGGKLREAGGDSLRYRERMYECAKAASSKTGRRGCEVCRRRLSSRASLNDESFFPPEVLNAARPLASVLRNAAASGNERSACRRGSERTGGGAQDLSRLQRLPRLRLRFLS